MAGFGSRTGGDHQRDHAKDECECGHQDGAQADAGTVEGRFFDGLAGGKFVARKLDDQDGIFCRHADQKDQADLGINIVDQHACQHAHKRSEDGDRCCEQDADGKCPAFVEGGENQEDREK